MVVVVVEVVVVEVVVVVVVVEVVVGGATVDVVVVEVAEAAAAEAASSGIVFGVEDWVAEDWVAEDWDAAGSGAEDLGSAGEAPPEEASVSAVAVDTTSSSRVWTASETSVSIPVMSSSSPDEQAAATKARQTKPHANRRPNFKNLFIPQFYKPPAKCPVTPCSTLLLWIAL